jgi:hypothetical protein
MDVDLKIGHNIMKMQLLRQAFKITEYRDNAIFKTQDMGFVWMTQPIAHQIGDIQYISPSTSVIKVHKTLRMVADDTPDIVETKLN